MDVDDETDLYLEQLKEVFDSCDSFDKGYLSHDELLKLCYKLQLEEQAEAIVEYLTENADEAKVTFEAFKENFVEILCQSTIERVAGEDQNGVNNKSDEADDQNQDDDETEEESEETDSNDEEYDEEEIVEEQIINEDKDSDLKECHDDDQSEISIKKYGRKSRPLSKEDFEELNLSDVEVKTTKLVKGKPPIKPKKQVRFKTPSD